MFIELAKSHFGSLTQNIPEVKLHNMYVSENPLSPTGYSYTTRPIVQTFADFGLDVIRGVFYQQGFANDLVLVVAGETLFSVTDAGVKTTIGTIAGSDICYFASTVFGIGIVSGGVFYIYDGTTITTVVIPDDDIPATVTSFSNYFVISIVNSNKFYWVKPAEVTIDPLSFASAEANADHIVSIKTLSDELWIIGKETTEVWTLTGDDDAPFVRIAGRVFNRGCAAATSVSSGVFNSLPCLLWVSTNREVLLSQGSPNKISNDFVEEVLKRSTFYRAWYFQVDRNDFYVLTTDVMTLVFDLSTNNWYRWSTFNEDTWKISGGVEKDITVYGASLLVSSNLYKLQDGAVDSNGEWLVCEVTGFVPHTSRASLPCVSIELLSNVGFGSSYLVEPIVEMRWSDDQGANWSTYSQASLGARGDANNRTQFRSLGLIRTPGRRFEFRFSLSEQFRLDYVIMNHEA